MITRAKLSVIISVLDARRGVLAYSDDYEDEDDELLVVPNEERSSAEEPDGIAVVDIFGSLVKRARGMDAQSGMVGYETLETTIMDAATRPNVKGILLNVDSYGGTVNGAFDLSDLIYSIRQQLPVYAVANDNALSAGYLLASAAEKVFVTQTGALGSVGVLAVHADQSKLDGKIGVKYTTVKYGSQKTDYDPHEPLSKQALNRLQAEVNRLGEKFVSAVSRNRDLDADAVRKTQAGIFAPEDALAIGFADTIGTQADALEALQNRVSASGTRRSINRTAAAAAVGSGSALLTATKEETRMGKEDQKKTIIEPEEEEETTEETENEETTEEESTEESTDEKPAEKPGKQATASASTRPLTSEAAGGIRYAMNAAQIHILSNMCVVAGQPDLLAGFLSRGLTFEAAQKELVKLRAKSGGEEEIISEVLPHVGTKAENGRPASALMAAVVRRIKGGK